MNLKLLLLLFLVIPFALSTYGQGEVKHSHDHGNEDAQLADSTAGLQEVHHHDSPTSSEGSLQGDDMEVAASLDEFPHLHPLIVHFPIVLLIVAAVIALSNIIFLKKELDWIISVTLLFGFIGAYAAGRWFHPHTHELSEHAKLVLERHDLWADRTVYLALAGLIFQAISQFVLNQKRWACLVVSLILLSSAYAVSRTGHYGAQLVHIEGIGPQGKFLKSNHQH